MDHREHREHMSADAPHSTAPEQEILAAVRRYVDGYGWSWNMARRLVNRYFGTGYTDAELKKLYRRQQEKTK